MNAVVSESPSFKQSLLGWLERHKKGYFSVVLLMFSIGGMIPGVGLTYAFFLCEQRHVHMTLLQASAFGLSGPTVALFGMFIGFIAACLIFLADAICFSPKPKTETP